MNLIQKIFSPRVDVRLEFRLLFVLRRDCRWSGQMFFGSDMSVGVGGSAASAAARVLPLPLPTLPSLCDGPAVCARGSELVSV